MGKSCSLWVSRLAALLKKDLLEEFRTRYAINALLMFAVTALVMVSFAVGVNTLSATLHAALLWIILFFASMSGLGRSFVKEEEKNTAPALRLAAPAEVVYVGKLVFNFLIMLVLAALILLLYLFLLNPPLGSPALLVLVIFLGVAGLSGATTILAAIVARAANQGTLLPVLSFPVLLPLLITAINATRVAIEGGGVGDVSQGLLFLVAYGVIIITASLLLFDFVWSD
ncbi:MAG TPA: heme exporter protein CcmB [Bacillota bacterium]|nr:heme exporter protein CcmB [Bacillota bacterium]